MFTKAQLEEELTTLRATLEELLAERSESVTPAPARGKTPASKPAKKPTIAGLRFVKAGVGREVSMPEPVNGVTLGTTFAHWKDGEIKRRAWSIPGALVVDTRGLNAEGIKAIGKAWNARAKSHTQGALVIFSKTGE
jgi:hypothetical protein